MNFTFPNILPSSSQPKRFTRNAQREARRREETSSEENNVMLQLHLDLSKSLYKDKSLENERLSVKIVLLVTVLVTIGAGCFDTPRNAMFILMYLLIIWILPMWLYTVGVTRVRFAKVDCEVE